MHESLDKPPPGLQRIAALIQILEPIVNPSNRADRLTVVVQSSIRDRGPDSVAEQPMVLARERKEIGQWCT
jgi:hypothetical protein